MKRIRSKKGFTLAELLIVIAIIAILIAIAIPTFSAQLEGARIAVDMSNARAASSLAYSEYMLYHSKDKNSGAITYTFGTDDDSNLFIMSHSDEGGKLSDGNDETDGTEIKAKSEHLGNMKLEVVIDDSKFSKNTWLSELGK